MINIRPFQQFRNTCTDYKNIEVEIKTNTTAQPSKISCKYLRVYHPIHKKTWNWQYDAEIVIDSSQISNFQQLQPQINDRLTHESLGQWKILEIGVSPITDVPSLTLKLKEN